MKKLLTLQKMCKFTKVCNTSRHFFSTNQARFSMPRLKTDDEACEYLESGLSLFADVLDNGGLMEIIENELSDDVDLQLCVYARNGFDKDEKDINIKSKIEKLRWAGYNFRILKNFMMDQAIHEIDFEGKAFSFSDINDYIKILAAAEAFYDPLVRTVPRCHCLVNEVQDKQAICEKALDSVALCTKEDDDL